MAQNKQNKGAIKKPVVRRSLPKAKNSKRKVWLLLGVIFLIVAVCGAAFYAIKAIKKTTTPKKSNTVYVKAKEKAVKKNGSKGKDKSYSDKQPSSSVTKKAKKSGSNDKVPEKGNLPVSKNAKEWQPISPGLREATKAFKNLVYGGIPITKHQVTILENMSYYAAYCEKRRNPLWVAYRLDLYKGQNKLPRPGGFLTDFRTKAKINQKVYSKTGYDRGHMCPNSAIAARYDKKGQVETFLMSNICPQKPLLNRKVWERLERLEESYATKFDGVYIITGPIFGEHIKLMNKQVEIPEAFFKILIDEENGKLRVLPFVVPQDVTGKEPLNDYLTTVDDIERQTGLDFFAPLDDEYENKLESYLPDRTLWR